MVLWIFLYNRIPALCLDMCTLKLKIYEGT